MMRVGGKTERRDEADEKKRHEAIFPIFRRLVFDLDTLSPPNSLPYRLMICVL
jgi:hypothetical protein